MAITIQITKSGRPKPCRAAIENTSETAPQICPRNLRQITHLTAPTLRLRYCFAEENTTVCVASGAMILPP